MPVNNRYAFSNIQRLIKQDDTKEDLFIFTGQITLLKALINSATKVYGLFNLASKYRFAETLPEALDIIEKHKSGS